MKFDLTKSLKRVGHNTDYDSEVVTRRMESPFSRNIDKSVPLKPSKFKNKVVKKVASKILNTSQPESEIDQSINSDRISRKKAIAKSPQVGEKKNPSELDVSNSPSMSRFDSMASRSSL